MQCPINPAAPLLPHSGDMVLLESVESHDDENLRGTAYIAPDSPMADNGFLASWAAMEIMSQGIAALSGALCTDAGLPVRLGFLLGTRKLELFFDKIATPCRIGVTVAQSVRDNTGFGVFDCTLTLAEDSGSLKAGTLLARAALNAFQPENIQDYLRNAP